MRNIDWSTLHHAYGLASDIPGLLEGARRAAAPVDYQDEPWFSLWSALCHQGDVYTASYAAVSELIGIAEDRRSEIRVATECLYMAAIIELERAAPEGPLSPPEMPQALAVPYQEALVRGAGLAADILPRANEAREMINICIAVFGGDLERARFLADGPDEETGGSNA
jgi:hypothetical protein